MLTLKYVDVVHIENELAELVRMFSSEVDSDAAIEFCYGKSEDAKIHISIVEGEGEGEKRYSYKKSKIDTTNNLEFKKLLVRNCKIALYKALKSHFGVDLPWGALTGIRPTKMVYEKLFSGKALKETQKILQADYFVSSEKSQLAVDVVKAQSDCFASIEPLKEQLINLYVHIPFCKTRCNYCSFVSVPMQKQAKLVGQYIKHLTLEIAKAKKIIERNNQKIYSIYIGGGTPTAISDSDFLEVLKAIGNNNEGIEYTVEAGRPDTITKQKLDIMAQFNVGRISVNPQTLNNNTLQLIGRQHTAEDFFNAYSLVESSYNFDINVDLILGLQNETQEDFNYTLHNIIKLNPANITLHTLCKKRGSKINENSKDNKNSKGLLSVATIPNITAAIKTLASANYTPYYLYRQKQALGNLENIGFSKPKKQCVNNITVMEEQLSTIALGAGAISKRIFIKENRIERQANPKDVICYLERQQEISNSKLNFWH